MDPVEDCSKIILIIGIIARMRFKYKCPFGPQIVYVESWSNNVVEFTSSGPVAIAKCRGLARLQEIFEIRGGSRDQKGPLRSEGPVKISGGS
jgi:hypothetical protein